MAVRRDSERHPERTTETWLAPAGDARARPAVRCVAWHRRYGIRAAPLRRVSGGQNWGRHLRQWELAGGLSDRAADRDRRPAIRRPNARPLAACEKTAEPPGYVEARAAASFL